VDSHAPCVLSGAFSEQGKKGKENQQDAIFLKKIHFFFILISEFQMRDFQKEARVGDRYFSAFASLFILLEDETRIDAAKPEGV